MFKKITIALSCALTAFLCIFGLSGNIVKADSSGIVGELSTVTATSTSLGLPSSFTYDWTRSNVDLTGSSVTVNGIKYTISGGNITAAEVPSNAADIKTIGILFFCSKNSS